jgi:hypothetical protein
MSKEEAVAYLLKIDFDNGNKAVRAALEAAQEKRAEKPAKVKAPVAEKKKAPVKGKAKVVMTTAATETVAAQTEDENAPF